MTNLLLTRQPQSVWRMNRCCAPPAPALWRSPGAGTGRQEDTAELMRLAADLRDMGHRNVISYSRKVFIPLTQLCRDVRHYRTFAQTPKGQALPYMSVDAALALAREGAAQGCREAPSPWARNPNNATAPPAMRCGSSVTRPPWSISPRWPGGYSRNRLAAAYQCGLHERGEIAMLRPVSASMGIMLESTAQRLCEKGGPHYASPDKDPALRLETLRLAGEACVPFTTGILIGIGETRGERIESPAGDSRPAPALRPYPGSDHPEFSGQARYAYGWGSGTRTG